MRQKHRNMVLHGTDKQREEVGVRSLLNLMNDAVDLGGLAYLSCIRRLGYEKAVDVLVNGEVWKVLAGGADFETLSSANLSYDAYAMLERDFHNRSTLLLGRAPIWAHTVSERPIGFTGSDPELVSGRIAMHAGNKWLFATTSGYLGIGAHAVEEDDVVCVLLECSWPVILRPQADGSFRLVTFAYVNGGVNTGQIVKKLDPLAIRLWTPS